MKKSIAMVALALFVAITSVTIMMNVHNRHENNRMLGKYSERHIELNNEKTDILRERAEFVSMRAAETRMGNYLILYFDNLDKNLIDEVYPLLNSYGHRGTVVMRNGLVPGEGNNISKSDFDFLLSKGWDTAIGTSNMIDMKSKNAPELLDAYLSEYTERLKAAEIEIPYVFCFSKGEYDKRFESVIEKYGFKMIRHYGEAGELFGSAYIENEPYYIGSGVYSASATSLQEFVDEAYTKDLSFSISVRYIANSSIDMKLDCTTSKYERMLAYVDKNCTGTIVCTASELYEAKVAQHASVIGVIGEYNQKIAELDKRIEEIDAEKVDIIRKIQGENR